MTRRITFVPVAVALLYFPSVMYRVALDGAESDYFGFPIPWNSRSLVTSLAKNVYVIPLVIDLFFYGSIAYVVWRFVSPSVGRLGRHPAIVVELTLWAWGLICLLFIAGVIAIDPTFHWWPDPGEFRVTEFSVRVGV